MEFVKAHWVSLLSGAVGVIAIALAVLGMTRDSVLRELNQHMQTASEINSLRGAAQNEETIAAEKERGQRFEQEYEAVVRTAETINEQKPLMEGVFPRPAQLDTPYRFKDEYVKRILELPRELRAGDLPNEQEWADELEIAVEQERRKRQEAGEDVSTTPPTAQTPSPAVPGGGRGAPAPGGRGLPLAGGRGVPPAGGRGMPPAGGRGAPGGAQPVGVGAAAGAGQSLPPGVTAEDIRRRAAIKKAHNIRVYLSPVSSLHLSPIWLSEEAPTPRDMWYAQVSLWVQEDLLRAIARVNEEAAEKLGEKEANVENMPVKHVESIRLLGYVTSGGFLVTIPVAGVGGQGAGAGSPQVGPAPPSFTGRKSDDNFDVIRVVLTVIVDERKLLKLIDAVIRANFYQLVGAEYTRVEAEDPQGYFYGGAPLIRAGLDFEGYLARKMYKGMMPTEVLQDLGIASTESPGLGPGQ